MEHNVPTDGGEISRRQHLQIPLIVNHVINASMFAHLLTVGVHELRTHHTILLKHIMPNIKVTLIGICT